MNVMQYSTTGKSVGLQEPPRAFLGVIKADMSGGKRAAGETVVCYQVVIAEEAISS